MGLEKIKKKGNLNNNLDYTIKFIRNQYVNNLMKFYTTRFQGRIAKILPLTAFRAGYHYHAEIDCRPFFFYPFSEFRIIFT